MIGAALLFAAVMYKDVLNFDPPPFQAGAAKYEFYAQGDLQDGRRVVVYGFTPVRRGTAADYEHEIFVAMITRRGPKYEIVSSRRLMTDAVFNTGERGHFRDFQAVVNAFSIGDRQYVDVSFWSSITGGSSQANDVIYRVANDGTLVIAARVDETQARSRIGTREIREITSDIGVTAGMLVVEKHERLASRATAAQPYRVNCQTTRIAYRPRGHAMEQAPSAPKGKITLFERVPVKAILPCCNGCEWSP